MKKNIGLNTIKKITVLVVLGLFVAIALTPGIYANDPNDWTIGGNNLGGGGTGNLGPTSNDDLAFITNNQQRMVIKAGGNIGIGLATPSHKLEISDSDTTANRAGLYIAQTGAISGTGYGLYVSKTGASTTNVGGYFSATEASNNYGLIVEDGYVGIGTILPDAPLDIEAEGTPESHLEILHLVNTANAAEMAETETSITFFQTYYDESAPNVGVAARVTMGTETSWTAFPETQDSYLAFSTLEDVALNERMRITSSGNVGIGTTTPGSTLEVNGPIEIDSMRFIQGEQHYGDIGSNHWFELFTAQHSYTAAEYEIWGTVICRRCDFAKAAYMPFILTVKQRYGPLSTYEPTIQFKYWKHGALDNAELLALRTSAAGADPKEIKVYVKAPNTYPTLNWEYHYNDDHLVEDFFTIDQSPDDVGTTKPSGTAPDYYGDELFAIDGGNVGIGIGTTNPSRKLHIKTSGEDVPAIKLECDTDMDKIPKNLYIPIQINDDVWYLKLYETET